MFFRLIIFSFLFIFSTNLKATHIVGGDLQYEYLGNDVYEVTLSLYKDCTPYVNAAGDTVFPIEFQNIFGQPPIFTGTGNAKLYMYTSSGLDSVYFTSLEITSVDLNNPNPCLQVDEDLCVKLGEYKVEVTIPSTPGGVHLSYQLCCRNIGVLNIVDPLGTGITIPAFIPERDTFGDNSNPKFDNYPPLIICLENPLNISQAATDTDGDSLVYSLTTPLNGPGPNTGAFTPPYPLITWETGYSSNNPVVSSPVVNIDPETGVITGTSTQLGSYIVGILVQEYRNGVLLSETIRDFRFMVIDCNLTVSSFPQADFTCLGYTVDFINESHNASTFYWDFGDPNTTTDISSQQAPSYTYSESGTYTVMLIANPLLDCADTSFVTFTLDASLEPVIDPVGAQCFENNSYDFTFSGYYPPGTTFDWDFGPNATPQNSTDESPTGIHFSTDDSQTITLVLYYNQCEDSTVFTFDPEPEVYANVIGPYVGCEPFDLELEPNPYNVNYTYNWIIGEDTIWNDPFPSLTLDIGMYDIQLNTITPENCESEYFESDFITVHPQPVAGFMLSDTLVEVGDLIKVTDLSQNATEIVYSINGGADLPGPNTQFTPTDSGTYVITQIVNNAGDCPDELTKEITVENHYWIRFPNVFSPNGDNLNDYFNPKHYKIKSYTLKIFDRWGEQVFNGAVPLIEHRWYGDRLDGEKSDQAVYYYQCVFTTNRDLVFEQEGTVTLIK